MAFHGRNPDGQRRAVFAKGRLRRRIIGIAIKQGFEDKLPKNPKVELTKNFARIRIEDPNKFSRLRHKDVGKKDFTELIVGRPKGKKTTELQSILLNRRNFEI